MLRYSFQVIFLPFVGCLNLVIVHFSIKWLNDNVMFIKFCFLNFYDALLALCSIREAVSSTKSQIAVNPVCAKLFVLCM